jgi:hypothetical protein
MLCDVIENYGSLLRERVRRAGCGKTVKSPLPRQTEKLIEDQIKSARAEESRLGYVWNRRTGVPGLAKIALESDGLG